MKYRIIASLAVIVFLMFVFAVPAQSTTLYNGVEHHVYIMKEGDTVAKYAIVHTGHMYNWKQAVVLNPKTGSRYTESQYNRLPIGTIVAFPVTKTEQEKASTLVSVPSTAQSVAILRSGVVVEEATSEKARLPKSGPRYIHVVGQFKLEKEMKSVLGRIFTQTEKSVDFSQEKLERQATPSIAEVPPFPARANKEHANIAKVNTSEQSKISPPEEQKAVTEGSKTIADLSAHERQKILIERQKRDEAAVKKEQLALDTRFPNGSRKEKVVEGRVSSQLEQLPDNSSLASSELLISPGTYWLFVSIGVMCCLGGSIYLRSSSKPAPIDSDTIDNFTKVKTRVLTYDSVGTSMRRGKAS